MIITTAAVDFLNGGTPTFARAFDRHGVKLWSARRRTDEPWKAFCSRMKEEAAEVAGVRSLTIGGLPDEALDMSGAESSLPRTYRSEPLSCPTRSACFTRARSKRSISFATIDVSFWYAAGAGARA